jgi:hypothetical protein
MHARANMSASIEALLMAANSETSYMKFHEHDESYIPPYLLACNCECDASSSDEEDDSMHTSLEDYFGDEEIAHEYVSDEEIVRESIRKCTSWIEENYIFL